MVIQFNVEFKSYLIAGSELCVTPVYSSSFELVGHSVCDLSLNELFTGPLHACFEFCAVNFSSYAL